MIRAIAVPRSTSASTATSELLHTAADRRVHERIKKRHPHDGLAAFIHERSVAEQLELERPLRPKCLDTCQRQVPAPEDFYDVHWERPALGRERPLRSRSADWQMPPSTKPFQKHSNVLNSRPLLIMHFEMADILGTGLFHRAQATRRSVKLEDPDSKTTEPRGLDLEIRLNLRRTGWFNLS